MSEWKVVKLGDICNRITSGGTPKTSKKEYYGGKIPWVRTQEVNFNRIYDAEIKITEEGLSNSSAKWIPKNSVIIAMYGATAGKVAINKVPVATNQACCNLIINNDEADYRFIYYNILSRFSSIANMAVGGAQQNLNAGMIRDLPISLPKLPTQTAIAEILSSLDDKIELNNKINQELENLAQLLFKRWFVDFEFPNENGEPYKSSGGEMVDSELGEIPKGWVVGNLNQIATLSKRNIKPFENPDVVYYHYSLPEFDSGKVPSKEFGDQILSSKYQVLENTILVSKLNPRIPRVWTVINPEKNSICSTEFQVLKPIEVMYFSFINCLCSSDAYTTSLQSKVTGTSSSHQRVNPIDIINFEMIMPPDSILNKFHYLSYEQLILIENNRTENIELASLRDTLLPKLISGELDVATTQKQP
jgi:type I restriction enzyme S subunit